MITKNSGQFVFLIIPATDGDSAYNTRFGLIADSSFGSGTTHELRVNVDNGDGVEDLGWFRTQHVFPLAASPFLLKGSLSQVKAFVQDFRQNGGVVTNPLTTLDDLAPIEVDLTGAQPRLTIKSVGYKVGYKLPVVNAWDTVIAATKQHLDKKFPSKIAGYNVEIRGTT
jgi:hypothetical protein